MTPRVNIITVAVADLRKSLAFYRNALGWTAWWPDKENEESADHAAFKLENGLSLVLYPRDSMAREAGQAEGKPNSAEFSLTQIVPHKVDVDALIARAEAGGANILSRPHEQPWGYSARFKDLDGHVWEVMWQPSDVN